MTQRHTGDSLRETYASLYPRPGWRARNLDADGGRVYDFEHFRDHGARVDCDWDHGRVTAHFDDKQIGEWVDVDPDSRTKAFVAVEDACAASLGSADE